MTNQHAYFNLKSHESSQSESINTYFSLQLSIIDTGCGISSEGVQNLFIDFGKLSENQGRNKSGTGLGLSICKMIIEEMGGKVTVESKLNVGTEFSIFVNA
jgi:signal transduction histidine kinase